MIERLSNGRIAGIPPQFLWLTVALLIGLGAAVLPLPMLMGMMLLVVVVVAVLYEPLIGVALMLLAGPWGATESLLLEAGSLDTGQILFFVTVGAWLAQGAVRHRLFIPYPPILIPLVAFILVGMLSLYDAPSLSAGISEVLKWVEIAILSVMTIDLVENSISLGRYTFQQRLYLIVGIVLLAGLTQGILGFWQFSLWGVGIEHFQIREGLYRAFGTFVQPNPYGGYVGLNLALSAGILAGILITQEWRGTWQEKIWSGFILEATMFLALGLIASWSRGAWLGFAAAFIVIVFFASGKWRWLGIPLLGVGIALLGIGLQLGIVPETLSERLTTGLEFPRLNEVREQTVNPENYATLERFAHWYAALEMGRDDVWLGVGFGNYEAAYEEYALPRWDDALGHAHNYYLNLIAEVGFIGTILYLTFWGIVLGQCLYLLRELEWTTKGIALGLTAAWVALAVHHLVDKLYVNNIYLHMGVMLGVQQLLARRKRIRLWSEQ